MMVLQPTGIQDTYECSEKFKKKINNITYEEIYAYFKIIS